MAKCTRHKRDLLQQGMAFHAPPLTIHGFDLLPQMSESDTSLDSAKTVYEPTSSDEINTSNVTDLWADTTVYVSPDGDVSVHVSGGILFSGT